MEGEGLGVLDHSSSRLFGHASPVLEHQTQQGRIAHTPRKLWRWYNKAWAPMHQLLTNPSRPGSRPDRTPSGVFWIRRTLDYRMSPMVHGSTASMGPIANPRIIPISLRTSSARICGTLDSGTPQNPPFPPGGKEAPQNVGNARADGGRRITSLSPDAGT